MTWNLAPFPAAFCLLHCKNVNDLYCWSCQCQCVCALWLSWQRLRNVWLGKMFLWPESEMRVGVSFYVMGSGVFWVGPLRNCWNQSSLDCRSHPTGYMCNLFSPTISTFGARRECKTQKIYVMNRAIVPHSARWESWLSCWLGKPESWTAGFTTVRRSEAARWRTCVRISSALDTTTRAKTTSPQESLGNEELMHPLKHNSHYWLLSSWLFLFCLSFTKSLQKHDIILW